MLRCDEQGGPQPPKPPGWKEDEKKDHQTDEQKEPTSEENKEKKE
jgi:hypothetical protein